MKCVILAGGMQSTLAKSGEAIPKPMIEIGGKPLIWHIMKHFSECGINEFIVCGGYKIEVIKEYFLDYYIYESDITVDLSNNEVFIHKKKTEAWKVAVVDTGINASVLDRIIAVDKYLTEDFIVTYGDCLSDIDLRKMNEIHLSSGALATLALAKTSGRKQLIQFDSNGINSQNGNDAWISGDCFILNKKVLKMIFSSTISEQQLFSLLDKNNQLSLYYHKGYWNAVETMRDLVSAERLWDEGVAPWITCI